MGGGEVMSKRTPKKKFLGMRVCSKEILDMNKNFLSLGSQSGKGKGNGELKPRPVSGGMDGSFICQGNNGKRKLRRAN